MIDLEGLIQEGVRQDYEGVEKFLDAVTLFLSVDHRIVFTDYAAAIGVPVVELIPEQKQQAIMAHVLDRGDRMVERCK